MKLESDGVSAWSECVAGEEPGYSYETTDSAWRTLTRWLLPELVKLPVQNDAREYSPAGWIRGHPMAKAAVEMALWDMEAKRRGISLRALIGGTAREAPAGVSIGIQPSDDDLLRKVEGFLREGYRKIKIKIKPGRDVEMLAAVQKRFGAIPMMADANSAYRLPRDLSRLRELDGIDLLMVEQPLSHEDLLDHATLQANIKTPVCLDESIRSRDDARLAIHLGSGRIINIKPGRVGGFAQAIGIHDIAREAGWPAWCGGMLESGIGRAYNVALASLPGCTIPGDISESRRYWDEDIVTPEFEMENGMMPVPDGLGIGVVPRERRIRELTVRKAEFRSEL